jgi:hypothetical protein
MQLNWERKTIAMPAGRLCTSITARGLVCCLVSALVLAACVGGLAAGPAWAQESSCPNEQRRVEQPFASGLPDCRAYEVVSPLEKDDNGASYIASRAAEFGEAVTYFSLGSFAEPKAALLEGRYLSRREANGWSTRNISPPYTDYKGVPTITPDFGELLFTPDLSNGIVTSYFTPLVSGEPVGYINEYVADTETGAYEAVSNVTPTAEYGPFNEIPQRFSAPQVEGASTYLDRVVFQQEASLCCEASAKNGHVYEWAEGELSLVDVPPKGMKLEGYAEVGASANLHSPITFGDPWRAVSADGSRVFFTDQEKSGESGTPEGQLFVRENPTTATEPVEECSSPEAACTVEVSKSQKTNGTGPEGTDPNAAKKPAAWYRDASVDGSRVFFTSRVELTNDANTGPEDNAANLYEYDLNTGVLTDLTVDGSDPGGAGVLGVVTASDDGSYVYFVAAGKLGEGSAGGAEPVTGSPNLYVSHAGKVAFIATLTPNPFGVYNESRAEGNGDEADWVGEESLDNDFGPSWHTARVSDDGSLLAFESVRKLTSYDNEAAAPGECGDESCNEVYLYDAATGKLVCVSCDSGFGGGVPARPVGAAELGGHEAEPSSVTRVSPFYLPRNFSEDGGRLFFQSPDPLVPRASNGLLDVYEWEQPATPSETEKGENSCTTASPDYSAGSGGCVVPVSDVAGGFESHFMDASSSGDSVFIATGDQLVPSDTDTREDVYDVRVGGGFPVSVPAAACVNADSCKPPVSGQPGVFGAPASATFSGPGNPVPPPPAVVVKPPVRVAKCVRDERRVRGRCVREKTAKKARRAAKRGRRAGRVGLTRAGHRRGVGS